MFEKHKRKLIFSSLLILLPVLAGLILWPRLPDQMATHWGADGAVDGWSSRLTAVFLPPTLFLALHWLGLWLTFKDNRVRHQSEKVFGILFWLCPVLSLLVNAFTYAFALGISIQPGRYLPVPIGLALIVIGNYMPKCKQNRTIGIKIKWTLRNEANWNATHRLAGKVWVIGGLLIIVAAIVLPVQTMLAILPAVFLPMVLVPVGYSWRYHRKQVKNGTAALNTPPESKTQQIASKASLFVLVPVLVFCGVLLFTGDIALIYSEDSFTIEASYWPDLTVDYAAIEQLEYLESDHVGTRTNGYGSLRLRAGTFQTTEWGSYTRYSYTACNAAVLISVNGRTLVLNGPDVAQTKLIYEQLQTKLN